MCKQIMEMKWSGIPETKTMGGRRSVDSAFITHTYSIHTTIFWQLSHRFCIIFLYFTANAILCSILKMKTVYKKKWLHECRNKTYTKCTWQLSENSCVCMFALKKYSCGLKTNAMYETEVCVCVCWDANKKSGSKLC